MTRSSTMTVADYNKLRPQDKEDRARRVLGDLVHPETGLPYNQAEMIEAYERTLTLPYDYYDKVEANKPISSPTSSETPIDGGPPTQQD